MEPTDVKKDGLDVPRHVEQSPWLKKRSVSCPVHRKIPRRVAHVGYKIELTMTFTLNFAEQEGNKNIQKLQDEECPDERPQQQVFEEDSKPI